MQVTDIFGSLPLLCGLVLLGDDHGDRLMRRIGVGIASLVNLLDALKYDLLQGDGKSNEVLDGHLLLDPPLRVEELGAVPRAEIHDTE